ncbi:glycosyltransferase [Candidatus Pelagibacter sp.]|nr:glycosyltransferase [Candidatus Pelagibacter sp.]
MKNISLNFESLNSPDGGISRVANLVFKFFKERAKKNNDKIFLNIFRDDNIQNFTNINFVRKKFNNRSKLSFSINNFINSNKSDYIVYDHLGLARSNLFLIKKKPYIVFLYGIDIWDKTNKKRLEAQKKSSLSIAISNFTRKKANDSHGKLENVKVCWLSTIYNKVTFVKKKKKKFNFLFLSRLEKGKGHSETLDAFYKIKKKNVNLLIVGKGPENQNIKRKIKKLNLEKKVKLLGFVAEKKLNNIWSKTDVLIMPSRVEGFGLVYIEAMSRGIPIITSKQDAGKEVNLHGKTGFSVDLDSKKKDELFFYLNKISNNKPLVNKMGKNAKRRWLDNFTYKKFEKRFEILIKKFEKEFI